MQAQTGLLSSDLVLVTRLIDISEPECRERLAAASAKIDQKQLKELKGLLFVPREQPVSCS